MEGRKERMKATKMEGKDIRIKEEKTKKKGMKEEKKKKTIGTKERT